MELSETGTDKAFYYDVGRHKVHVLMTIKTPRGMCQIYGDMKEARDDHYWDKRCKAVKAFMEAYG